MVSARCGGHRRSLSQRVATHNLRVVGETDALAEEVGVIGSARDPLLVGTAQRERSGSAQPWLPLWLMPLS